MKLSKKAKQLIKDFEKYHHHAYNAYSTEIEQAEENYKKAKKELKKYIANLELQNNIDIPIGSFCKCGGIMTYISSPIKHITPSYYVCEDCGLIKPEEKQ